jgi:hypothetical protein
VAYSSALLHARHWPVALRQIGTTAVTVVPLPSSDWIVSLPCTNRIVHRVIAFYLVFDPLIYRFWIASVNRTVGSSTLASSPW